MFNKPPAIPKPASMPTSASFISASQGSAGMGQRPNKFVSPVTGASSVSQMKPSLLGGF